MATVKERSDALNQNGVNRLSSDDRATLQRLRNSINAGATLSPDEQKQFDAIEAKVAANAKLVDPPGTPGTRPRT